MPQETNLNVSPYFDDFDPQKNYYKVLFKPGFPIQARELNNLQSIAQNQIEQFGRNIFKDGSVVIPGQFRYNNPLYAVLIEPEFNGAPISLYFNNLLGAKIRGSESGVSAEIVYLLNASDSIKNTYTLYVKYLQSGGDNFETKVFQNGETLILENTLLYSNTSIQSGQGICNTLTENSVLEGSSVSVASGVYFVRGTFLNVNAQTILLDQYNTTPSYKVGFDVIETVVNSDEDPTLFDNAQGFSNYAAPGSDRFKIELELTKKNIDDLEVSNFVEILRVSDGIPQFFNKNAQYNLIRDELAKRTSDESGDYYVKPFTLFVRDSLNDKLLNNGIYFKNQVTVQGNTPSENFMVYQIGPGKAYVNGYDVETISPRLIDVEKPRTTETIPQQVISYNSGTLAIVNNCYGSPYIGLGTDATVSLMSSRIGSSPNVASGTTIGVARVYDFVPESNYVDDTSRLTLRLFDIQTYTKIGLTTSFPSGLSTPCFIEGKKSRATGYLKTSASSSDLELILYETSGNFLQNEQIIINGIDNGRLINSVTDYSLSDVKSIYSNSGFNADLILSDASYILPQGTIYNVNNGTVSSGLGNNFLNSIKVGDIVSYANTQFSGDPIYNTITSVSAGGTSFTISGITTVSGVCNGKLPTGSFQVSNIIKLTSIINSQSQAESSLLTRLTNDNISSINFDNNEITQRRSYTVSSFSGNSLSIIIDPADVDLYFDSFDEDKFMIIYSDGSIEPMRYDKYYLDPNEGGKKLYFNGLTKSSDTNTKVIATVRNLKPNSKTKIFNNVSSLVISYSKLASSGIGTTTLNDGLTYSNVYGTRVQDREICLNVPDVVRVLAIYESNSILDPSTPSLEISENPNGNTNFIVGEKIEGQSSGAVAIVVDKFSSNRLEFVYLNLNSFQIGELIEGNDSKEVALISNKFVGDKNITKNYLLDDGQRDTHYDYSRIVRKNQVQEPNKKIKIIYQNYTINSTDTGEFITVNSYSEENFKHNIPLYKNSRVSDYIDIRPRVAPYVQSSKSPFEFDSRNFASDGQYSKYILAPQQNLIFAYSYYIGRIDKVFLNSDGTFEVSKGIPASNPLPPPSKSNGLEICTVYIPPYVYNVEKINVDMTAHKRYRMSDIALLENRLERVEKFTTLTALESKTERLTIKDAETGLDRFKCGFFVDNFSSHTYHDLQNSSFKTAIDTSTNTLRPRHYTTSIDLQLGSEVINGVGQNYYPNRDHTYVSDLGSPNIKKTGDLVTLNYTNVEYFKQPFASTTESVTPFLVKYWSGSIVLSPPIDSWIDEKKTSHTSSVDKKTYQTRQDENITTVNGIAVDSPVFTNPPITQTGIDQFDWIQNAKNILANTKSIGGITVGMNQYNATTKKIQFSINLASNNNPFSNGVIGKSGFTNNGSTLHLEVLKSNFKDADRALIKQLLPPDLATQFLTQVDTKNGNNRVLIDFTPSGTATTSATTTKLIPAEEILAGSTTSESSSNWTETIRYLRSRNIEFDVKGLRPRTKFYSFFQGIDVNSYIIPKLLEIQMVSGKFQIGETVETDPTFTTKKIRFRLCKPNHKAGPYDGSPWVGAEFSQYSVNPYTLQTMPLFYSESSTFLNVDTKSLQLLSEVDYYGIIALNMPLIGKTSGAKAIITNIRLISDNTGRLIGSLYIPDPNIDSNPKWVNGENTFTLIDTPSLTNTNTTYDPFSTNSIARINESSAESIFTSSGTLNVTHTEILTTRNITVLSSYNKNTTAVTNASPTRIWENHDPLAQSFYVKDNTGVFLTSVDVFFENKDDDLPVTLQIRPMSGGVPSNEVVPFSEVSLSPNEVNLSQDGSVATNIVFPSPVYLPGPQQLDIRNAPIGSQQTSEFAIVLLSDSPNYRVFISRLGENDIKTGVKLSEQYTLGSLFKSQNGSVWTPSQFEDLKYTLYRADFVNEGSVRFFNPKLSLGNKKVTVTGENQLLPLSKKIIVGLGSTGWNNSEVVPGVTLIQNSASGKLVGLGGSITELVISNAGIGYTPNGIYTDVELQSETGSGIGAIVDVTVSDLKISAVTIKSGGFNYQIGDSLIIPEKQFNLNVGFGGKLTVSNISNTNNSLIIDNVQGKFVTGITSISYINSSNTVVSTGATINSILNDSYYDGLHMKIAHMNHGMHSPENYVKISEMRPLSNEVNSKISLAISSDDTQIKVESTNGFETFEGLPVNGTNYGYAIIGNEVIKYSAAAANFITVVSRGVDNTQKLSYDIGTPIYKYEFNGISLRRLNKVHNFANVENGHPITLDSYHIKIDTSDSDGNTDRTDDLYFKETSRTGKSGTVITNNIQFEAITPNISHIIPTKTNIDCRVRTFSGTSISGEEQSFVDDGFIDINLNETTYFANPKLICSDVNEEQFITSSPGNRSFTMEMLLRTEDSRISPVVDLIKTSVILTSNLIDAPLGVNEDSNYANDDSVRSLDSDKHAAIYISKPVRLQIPANSLKVFLSASHNITNDVRVLYQLFRSDAPEISQNYELFPGYSNYTTDGFGVKRIIDKSQNDGSADGKITISSDRYFKDYEYSAEDLPDFDAFVIKIVLAGKNQATPSLIKDLRAIATAKPRNS